MTGIVRARGGLRRTSVVVAAVVLVGTTATVASANEPTLHSDVTLNDITIPDAYLSAACGFDVNETLLNVHGDFTARANAAGEVASEVDTYVGMLRYSSPASGKSTTRRLNTVITIDYGNGAVEGGSALARSVGASAADPLTGQPGGGTFVANVQIVGFDAAGIPLTSYSSTISTSGEFDRATRTVCATLST